MLKDRRRYRAAAVGVALVIGALTLTPSAGGSASGPTLCLLCDYRALADAILNILLFAPFGVAVFLATGSVLRSIALSFAFSLGIEAAQTVWIPGRDANPGDLLFNSIGGGVGAALAASGGSWLFVTGRRRTLSSAALIGAALAFLTLASALLGPHIPATTWYGQWTPRLEHLEWYRGNVLDARVGTMAVPSERAPDQQGLRDLVAAGAPVHVRFVGGPDVSSLAPIFSIADDVPNSVLLIGIDGNGAVVRYRTLSAAVLLDQPDLRFPNAFEAVSAGDTVSLTLDREGDSWCLTVPGGTRCGIGFRPADTWGIFFFSTRWPGWLVDLIGFIWIAALFVPGGFFLPSTARARAAALAAAIAGLLIVPALTPVLPVAATEPAAAVAGFVAGSLLRLAVAALAGTSFAPSPP